MSMYMTYEELEACIQEADEQGDMKLRDILMDVRTRLEADEYAQKDTPE